MAVTPDGKVAIATAVDQNDNIYDSVLSMVTVLPFRTLGFFSRCSALWPAATSPRARPHFACQRFLRRGKEQHLHTHCLLGAELARDHQRGWDDNLLDPGDLLLLSSPQDFLCREVSPR